MNGAGRWGTRFNLLKPHLTHMGFEQIKNKTRKWQIGANISPSLLIKACICVSQKGLPTPRPQREEDPPPTFNPSWVSDRSDTTKSSEDQGSLTCPGRVKLCKVVCSSQNDPSHNLWAVRKGWRRAKNLLM